MFQREKFVEFNENALAAGRVSGVDPIEQITKRCIRIVKNPEDAEVIACVLCRYWLNYSMILVKAFRFFSLKHFCATPSVHVTLFFLSLCCYLGVDIFQHGFAEVIISENLDLVHSQS